MAGRGRELTMPAWMKKQMMEKQQIQQSVETPVSGPPTRMALPAPSSHMPMTHKHSMTGSGPVQVPAYTNTVRGQVTLPSLATSVAPNQFADAPEPTNGHSSSRSKGESPRRSSRHSRSRERHRSRSHSSRRKDKSERSQRSSKTSSSRRSRDRSPGRSSRHRDGDKDRSERRSRGSSRRSRSRSPSLSRFRRRRKNNFDVRPPGVTDENAAAYAAQAILQQNMAALSGCVGPASFGPPPAGGTYSASHQQTRHARRLYVGGIGEVQEQEISEFFNDVIDRALGARQEGGAVVSVYINRERHFAFVELKSIELTTACMNLDGISFRNQPLKVRRPNDYNPASVPKDLGPIPELNLAALGIVSTTVQDSAHKIFVGGIPYHLNDEQVKELLSAFGPLRSFHLVKELNTNLSKGYGFCEYMDPSVTDAACIGLNDMKLGDKTLTVRRAMSQENAKAIASAAGSVNSALSMGLDPTQAALQTISMAAAGLGALPAGPVGTPSRVIILLNMVTAEELEDEEEYADILDDIKSECERFGTVKSIVIPRPRDEYPTALGKVFVEFGEIASAQGATTELHGRGFANRVVAVEYMDEQKYGRREFS